MGQAQSGSSSAGLTGAMRATVSWQVRGWGVEEMTTKGLPGVAGPVPRLVPLW